MRYLLLSAFLAVASLTAVPGGGPAYQQDNSQDLQNFYSQLQSEIQKQTQLVNDLAKTIERRDVVTPDANVFRFENANTMLGVKKTLYANFYNTPSVQSPLVRQALLAMFKKEMITASDLAQLQAIVEQERPKYVNQPAAQPAAVPAATQPR